MFAPIHADTYLVIAQSDAMVVRHTSERHPSCHCTWHDEAERLV